jgi:hypothetical protein
MSRVNPFKGYPRAKYWINGDREAGVIVGLTAGKVASLRRTGKIPYYLFRSRYLYHLDELKEWMRLTPSARAKASYKYKIYWV